MKTFELPTKLKLFYDTWICGSPLMNKDKSKCHGEGPTQMLNDKGFMCCLGQFSNQAGVPATCLKGSEGPYSVLCDNHAFVTKLLEFDGTYSSSTGLTNAAIHINDCQGTTVKEKADELVELFAKYGIELELVGFPE